MNRVYLLLSIMLFLFVYQPGAAQGIYGLDLKKIMDIAELDNSGIANWAKSWGLQAQVVKRGEHTYRHWVPHSKREFAAEHLGDAACAKFGYVRSFNGFFRLCCEARYLESFVEQAVSMGYQLIEQEPVRNQMSKEHEVYLTYLLLSKPSDLDQPASRIEIAICEGWMELHYIR